MLVLALVVALTAAACSGTSDDTTTTTAATETSTTAAGGEPATGPSALTADAQDSDGSTIVVATVSLPSPGFIAVHGDADGSPGPVVGHSDLLPAGESTDVTVTLDEPLTASGTLWPMVHIDANGNGEYEFFPPDETIDVPGVTEGGDVAVISVEITVG
jgi:Cu/Zn superoxide dismutase